MAGLFASGCGAGVSRGVAKAELTHPRIQGPCVAAQGFDVVPFAGAIRSLSPAFDPASADTLGTAGVAVVALASGDLDGDGKKDLISATIRGQFFWAKNITDNTNPKFAKPQKLFTLKHW